MPLTQYCTRTAASSPQVSSSFSLSTHSPLEYRLNTNEISLFSYRRRAMPCTLASSFLFSLLLVSADYPRTFGVVC
eukprot:scaffold209990_cov36-Tisochrysis_lutea.AAC.1